jgi:polysaccharide biosynthesis PFTS motif protein
MRGPDFLIDGEKIRKSETAFFPLVPLQPEHVAALRALGSDVVLLPAPGTFFSEGKKWWRLLQASLREFPFGYREVEGAAANLFNYLRWKYILSRIELKNFITHADFGDVHVSRNIALKQSGATTWYYTDASNFGLNFRDEDGPWNRHPFWTYLHYDHFLTWYDYLAEYFAMHPGSFQDTKTVGCVWSQHIRKGSGSIFSSVFETGREPLDDRFKIVVFASTYTVNGITSYDEAIAFLEDIRRLADELGQTSVIVKEKKAKGLHLQADPVKGSQLLGILDDLSANPRIHVFTRDADTSQLIGDSDLCISFPFTSPTIEALSVDRPALWHDPQGIYRSNIYSEFDHVVTHGYDELKDTVLKHMRNRENRYDNPIPEGHPLIDPFRDGKAIERFRDLLCAAE